MEILTAAISAWILAQIIKVLITAIKYKKLTFYTLISSGGMPSSHTALVVALTTSVGLTAGIDTVAFAICTVFSLIIMYDATGVRRAVGEQGKKINKLLEAFYETNTIDNREFSEKIGEILGHTPLEVLAGLVLGILTALLIVAIW